MRLPRVRFTVRRMMVAVAVISLPLALRAYGSRRIDELRSPIAVEGWSNTALLLADGRTVNLPGIRELPRSSTGLAQAILRGVELGRDGRVYALIPVHHWCGNDPVREHIARVDLSYLLMFVGEGQTVGQIDPDLRQRMAEKPGGRFSASGWEYGEYLQFRGWCRRAADAGGPFIFQAGARSTPPRTRAVSDKAGTSDL